MATRFVVDRRTRLFDWRQAIVESKMNPTTKLVALVLSIHMNRAGESCFPGTKLLMDQASLGRSTVLAHLRSLEATAWIKADTEAGRGGPRAYTATFPAEVVARIVREASAEPSTEQDGSGSEKSRTVHEPSSNCPASKTPLSISEDERTRGRNNIAAQAPRVTWLTPFLQDWERRYQGKPNAGQLARSLKPLVEQHGQASVRVAWANYLAATDAAYASPSKFAATHGSWVSAPAQTASRRGTEAMADTFDVIDRAAEDLRRDGHR